LKTNGATNGNNDVRRDGGVLKRAEEIGFLASMTVYLQLTTHMQNY